MKFSHTKDNQGRRTWYRQHSSRAHKHNSRDFKLRFLSLLPQLDPHHFPTNRGLSLFALAGLTWKAGEREKKPPQWFETDCVEHARRFPSSRIVMWYFTWLLNRSRTIVKECVGQSWLKSQSAKISWSMHLKQPRPRSWTAVRSQRL